ncbi:MAG: flagellar hook capping FlgD N-terminal domain-containing protein [Pikeienuella sp.]
METTAATPATTAAATTATAATSRKGAGLGADFQTFLTLLTTQLNNQDPLNPTDSTEFVAQIAQFSGVEQQVKTNKTLETILSALGGQGLGALSPWLGASVETEAALRYDGETPVALSVDPAPEASMAFLTVKTADGVTVSRKAVDPRATNLTWDGAGAAAGFYRFTLERLKGDEPLPDVTPRGFATVVEARAVDSGAELVLESGDKVDAAAIRAIRRAPG